MGIDAHIINGYVDLMIIIIGLSFHTWGDLLTYDIL